LAAGRVGASSKNKATVARAGEVLSAESTEGGSAGTPRLRSRHASSDSSPPFSVDRHMSRIPTFRTIEEVAEFWDTHDLMDFEDELEIVTDVKFVPVHAENAITLVFDDATLAELTSRAHEQNTSPTSLARQWVMERLHKR
ncbi:MAG: CopG family antitoxin, partial [Thermomicrobiales bacterium]